MNTDDIKNAAESAKDQALAAAETAKETAAGAAETVKDVAADAATDVKEQASGLIGSVLKDEDKTDAALDAAAGAAKKVTGGRFDDQIDAVRDAADDKLGSI